MKTICVLIFASCFCVFSLYTYGADNSPLDRRARLKTELQFDEWIGKTRDGQHIFLLQLDMGALIPDDVEMKVRLLDAPVRTFRVFCERKKDNAKACRMSFEFRVFASMKEARELMLVYIENMAAPLPYLKKQWAKENVDYGDVSFGSNLWGLGNVLVELENRTHDKILVNEVFKSIDKSLRRLPETKPQRFLPEGFSLRKAGIEKGGTWELTMGKLPENGTVFLSAKDCGISQVAEKVIRLSPHEMLKQPTVLSLIIIRKEKESQVFQVALSE